jgi:Zn-dependent peptidase ImmA (M78 family)
MISDLMRSVEIEREHTFPSHDPEDFNEDIEQIAALVRAQWKLPRGPIKDLVGVIENAGGIVHFTDFGTPKLDAISQWIPSTPPVFLVNSEKPGDRVRFTLCHELGHIILHDQTMRELNEMEAQADRFAAAFLMPEQDILPDFDQRLTLPRFAQLKSKWRVSMAALAKRAYDLKQITERQYRSIFEDLSKSGYRIREPITITVQRPSLIQEIITSHITDLKYSVNELAEALSLYEDELVHEYLDQTKGPRLVSLPNKKPAVQQSALQIESDTDDEASDIEAPPKLRLL